MPSHRERCAELVRVLIQRDVEQRNALFELKAIVAGTIHRVGFEDGSLPDGSIARLNAFVEAEQQLQDAWWEALKILDPKAGGVA